MPRCLLLLLCSLCQLAHAAADAAAAAAAAAAAIGWPPCCTLLHLLLPLPSHALPQPAALSCPFCRALPVQEKTCPDGDWKCTSDTTYCEVGRRCF